MARIDYFFATQSPYAYLAGSRLEEIAARHGAEIAYRPLDLNALFARTGGVALKDRHPSRQEYRLQDLARRSALLGMKMNIRPTYFPTNGAPAAYAILAAQKAGGGDLGALVQGVLRAVWAEEKDIARDEVIRDCLEAAGFDPALADKGMLAGAEEYAANLEEAVMRGVFGAPFYVVKETDQRFWGEDRLEDLDAHLATLDAAAQ